MRTYEITFLDEQSTILTDDQGNLETYTLKAENPWVLFRILGLDMREKLESAASLTIDLVGP